MLLLFPCGCFNGILAALGIVALTFPDVEAGISSAENTYFAWLFGIMTLIAFVPGTILFTWGLRTLRQEA